MKPSYLDFKPGDRVRLNKVGRSLYRNLIYIFPLDGAVTVTHVTEIMKNMGEPDRILTFDGDFPYTMAWSRYFELEGGPW